MQHSFMVTKLSLYHFEVYFALCMYISMLLLNYQLICLFRSLLNKSQTFKKTIKKHNIIDIPYNFITVHNKMFGYLRFYE